MIPVIISSNLHTISLFTWSKQKWLFGGPAIFQPIDFCFDHVNRLNMHNIRVEKLTRLRKQKVKYCRLWVWTRPGRTFSLCVLSFDFGLTFTVRVDW